jgi:glutamate racemase
MSSSLPIGVFDSGLGGLTVLKSLIERLPSENFIYLGDVARLPYGTKSQAVVEKYVRTCVQFLVEHKVKWVVVACNTATAMALKNLQPEFKIGISGVIEPGVRAALTESNTKKILVLATQSTVSSEAYLSEFQRQGAHSDIQQLACPLLVPLAEEGWFDCAITDQVVRHYLESFKNFEYDTLLLGCTHYPLLEPAFRRVAGSQIKLVQSGVKLADELAAVLSARGIDCTQPSSGTLTCFATDEVPRARPIAQLLFGRQIEFEKIDLS